MHDLFQYTAKRAKVPDSVFKGSTTIRKSFSQLAEQILSSKQVIMLVGAGIMTSTTPTRAEELNTQEKVIQQIQEVAPSLETLSNWQRAKKPGEIQEEYIPPFPMKYRNIGGLSDFDLAALYTDKTYAKSPTPPERMHLYNRKTELEKAGWKVDFFDDGQPKKGPPHGPGLIEQISEGIEELFGK